MSLAINSAPTVSEEREERVCIALLVLLVIAFGAILIRTAWLCDDAFITFRTVSNLLDGYGLRWNVTERVQTYTHPLWLFVLALVSVMINDIVVSAYVVSLAVSLTCVVILAGIRGRPDAVSVVCVGTLILSKTLVDFSTSGLENPLAHLAVILLLCLFLSRREGLKWFMSIVVVAAALLLIRLDFSVFLIPIIVTSFPYRRFWKGLAITLSGMFPVLAWLVFATFYYGTPLPNTAYAKCGAGVDAATLHAWGVYYVRDFVLHDPVGAIVVIAGLLACLSFGRIRYAAVGVGTLLYLIYVWHIGGDFMSGRFFSTPIMAMLVTLAIMSRSLSCRSLAPAIVAFCLLAGLGCKHLYRISGSAIPKQENDVRVTDSQRYYVNDTGLTAYFEKEKWPEHRWAAAGRRYKGDGRARVVVHRAVGMIGFCAGPITHIIDEYALCDPLLCRLPARYPYWRAGHYLRIIPEGYEESLATRDNVLRDPVVAELYDAIEIVTRGELWSWERLRNIWTLNTRRYLSAADRFHFQYPDVRQLSVDEIRAEIRPGRPGIAFGRQGLLIRVAVRESPREVRLGLDGNEGYTIGLGLQCHWVFTTCVGPGLDSGATYYRVSVPTRIAEHGYDSIHIRPRSGHGQYHLRYLATD